jgi:hypothetical protein
MKSTKTGAARVCVVYAMLFRRCGRIVDTPYCPSELRKLLTPSAPESGGHRRSVSSKVPGSIINVKQPPSSLSGNFAAGGAW